MVETDREDGQREATELEERERGDVAREARRRGKEVERGGAEGRVREGGNEGGEGEGDGEEERQDVADGLKRVATFKPGQSKNGMTRFWTRQVVLSVHHEDCRDHFALERTYLSYFRISLGLAILGVVIAQLFRLQNRLARVPSPADPSNPALPTHPAFSFFRLAIPLAAICHGAAMLVALIGGFRFWRQQNALARGKVHVGGWEIKTVGAVALIAEVAVFALVMALQAREG